MSIILNIYKKLERSGRIKFSMVWIFALNLGDIYQQKSNKCLHKKKNISIF